MNKKEIVIEKKELTKILKLFSKKQKTDSSILIKGIDDYIVLKIINNLFTFEYRIKYSNVFEFTYIFNLEDFSDIVNFIKDKELTISENTINNYPIFQIETDNQDLELLQLKLDFKLLNSNFSDLIKYCSENKKKLKKSVFDESIYFILINDKLYHISDFEKEEKSFAIFNIDFFEEKILIIDKDILKVLEFFSSLNEEKYVIVDNKYQEFYSENCLLKINLPNINKKLFI